MLDLVAEAMTSPQPMTGSLNDTMGSLVDAALQQHAEACLQAGHTPGPAGHIAQEGPCTAIGDKPAVETMLSACKQLAAFVTGIVGQALAVLCSCEALHGQARLTDAERLSYKVRTLP
jgi:hypothetical protein